MTTVSVEEEIPEVVIMEKIDVKRVRYPFSIVWTPIPLLTWLFPFVGHTGIGMSNGVIRDFAGPYIVTEDSMAFGNPTKYMQMDPNKVEGGQQAWDRAIKEASEVYGERMHNLFCDNCHSHVCLALNSMHYDNKDNWNMVKLAVMMFFCGRYVNWQGYLKTWLPFVITMITIIALVIFL